MDKLFRIQKRNNLNEVFVVDAPHSISNGHHLYAIKPNSLESILIPFQKGARGEEGSTQGVLDTDLLEIVRHRLDSFQRGQYATRENALALTAVETALMWLTKRAEDRYETGKLGTNKI